MKHNLFEVSQYIVILNDKNEVLLLQASNITKISGKWGFPGGHINHEETIEESLKREVKEETNIEIKILSPIKTEAINKTYTIIFAAEYVSGEIKLSKEHNNYRWVKIGSMSNLNLIDKVLIDYAKDAMKLKKALH